MKIELPSSVLIAAPAAQVWRVIAHEYADIGQWAAAIPQSTALKHLPTPDGAPIGGRACHPAMRGFGTVHEQFIYFDDAKMRFGYAAIAGMPGFIRRAENHWAVHAVAAECARVETHAFIEVNDLLGWFLAPMLRWQLGRTGKLTLEELKYYIETGRPHPRKLHSEESFRRKATALYRPHS